MQRSIMTSRSFLRTPSEPAGPGDETVIEDLVDTLEANRSRCVGMAANMIGIGKRIIAFVDEDLGGRNHGDAQSRDYGLGRHLRYSGRLPVPNRRTLHFALPTYRSQL